MSNVNLFFVGLNIEYNDILIKTSTKNTYKFQLCSAPYQVPAPKTLIILLKERLDKLEEGVENAVLKDALYRVIIRNFIQRLNRRTQSQRPIS